MRVRSESLELFESFWPDMWPVRMPSVEAARAVDGLAWVRDDIFMLEPVALVWLPVWALIPAPAFCDFSAAQEGIAAAKAIAPTTPSMSGSFITALFMIAPPVLRPHDGGNRATKTCALGR